HAHAHVPHALLDRFDAAELEHRSAARFARVDAGGDLFVDQQIERRPHFGVELAIDGRAVSKVPPETAEPRQHDYVSSAWAMAIATRCHCAVSSPRRRRPAFVSE